MPNLVRFVSICLPSMILISLTWPAAAAHLYPETPEVEIQSGMVRGIIKDRIENFLGIPYAAPPVGNLRWEKPQSPVSWRGVREVSHYGSACPQSASLDANYTDNEDCLFINVQRPLGVTSTDKLPVLVYIHGGGWQTGSGNNENLDALVRENGIIGVTMNYRLGNLGFLAHPALEHDGDVGNYGLYDQLSALQWVQTNIARFGGDPTQVTLAGESAGAGSTCNLMASPLTKGLFTRAIMMSPLCYAIPKPDALKSGEKIAANLGCEGEQTAECLKALPVSKLLDKQAGIFSRLVKQTTLLPQSGWEQMQANLLPEIPIMIGSTRHEGRAFMTRWPERSVTVYDQASYLQLVNNIFGDQARNVLAVYPWPSNPTQFTGTYLAAEILLEKPTNSPGGLSPCKTQAFADLLAQRNPAVYVYEFAPQRGVGWYEIPGYDWGAGHATELPYLIPQRGNFANNGLALSPGHQQLAQQMLHYWGNFVKTGSPQESALPLWSPYRSKEGPVMELKEANKSIGISAVAFTSAHHCNFWTQQHLSVDGAQKTNNREKD